MVKSLPAKLDSDPLNLASNQGKVPEPTAASKPSVKVENTPLIIGIGASAGGLEALEQVFCSCSGCQRYGVCRDSAPRSYSSRHLAGIVAASYADEGGSRPATV